ncbi:MAG TPA: ABC transporter ATP-binding protein [Chloroflexota bacterium]|nr:ABC transporter ATP-binding protein [Chloroflexota bacterium]
MKSDPLVDAVALTDIVKTFGALRALDGLSLSIRAGTIYGILGPNGAGKTTMIRLIAGLLAADSGEARVLGDAPGGPAVLARTGYMPQIPALYEELTVRENVVFFAACYGRRDPAAADSAVEFVGLSDRSSSQVRTLSGGMRQRVSLACAVAHEPAILLLDEPTVGVDPDLRVQLWGRFRDMAARGATILVSSHIMDEAERCDTLGLILNGRLLAEGSVAEIRVRTGAADLEGAFLALAGSGNEPA